MKARVLFLRIFSVIFLCSSMPLFVLSQLGKTIRFTSVYAPFPDSARANGHTYQGKTFPASRHYNDSSVMIYVPTKFKPSKQVEIIVWFHGWNNNIDTALQFFKLVEQFEASNRNAILVFPEGPKNAPDSYGGKLERPGYFNGLMNDVIVQLISSKILRSKDKPMLENCSISLAGHSGAYRVISKILPSSKVDEVFLFDALYGGNDAYIQWISANNAHRFISIYTKDGGTWENTRMVMKQLTDSWKVSLIHVKEAAVNEALMNSNNIIFIDSEQSHNDVITHENNWERFLKYRPKKTN